MTEAQGLLVGFNTPKSSAAISGMVLLLSLIWIGTFFGEWSDGTGRSASFLVCIAKESEDFVEFVLHEDLDRRIYSIYGIATVTLMSEKVFLPPIPFIGFLHIGDRYYVNIAYGPSRGELESKIPPWIQLPHERDVLEHAIFVGSIEIPFEVSRVPESAADYEYRRYNWGVFAKLFALAVAGGVSGYCFFRTVYFSTRTRMRLSRNVCLQCGYPRVGIVEDVPCPECGFRSGCRRLQN